MKNTKSRRLRVFGRAPPPKRTPSEDGSQGVAYLLDISNGRVMWSKDLGAGAAEADPAIADINGDGFAEIIVAAGSRLHVLNGLGNFGRLGY